MKVFDNNSVQLDFDEIQNILSPILSPFDYVFNPAAGRWEKTFDDLKYSTYYAHLLPKLIVEPPINFYLLFEKDTPILVNCAGFEEDDELKIFKDIVEEATLQLQYESNIIKEQYDKSIQNILDNWTGEISHAK